MLEIFKNIMKFIIYSSLLFSISLFSQVVDNVFPGTISNEFKKIQKLNGYDLKKPSVEVINKIYTPLRDAKLPFDLKQIKKEFNAFGPFVSTDAQLITLHRLPSRQIGLDKRYLLSEDRYSETAFNVDGVGSFYFHLGHPIIKELMLGKGYSYAKSLKYIPTEKRPDLGMIKRSSEEFKEYDGFEVSSDIKVYDEVYVIHSPFLEWLSIEEIKTLNSNKPFVSKGKIVKIDGNCAYVDVMVSQGSSGGTVFNKYGKVIGVISASFKSKDIPPLAIFMRINPEMERVINIKRKPQ